MNYIPSIVEINGTAWWPENQDSHPSNIGLFSIGDIGIAATTNSSVFPAIIGYKPQEVFGYAISGVGCRGVFGKSTSTLGIGVHGSANDTGSCGVVGTNNVTIENNMPVFPESVGKNLKVGVYGSGKGNEGVPSLDVAKEIPPVESGVGILGNGTSVGVMGVVDGELNNTPVGKYAGYFDGDVKVTGTLRVERVCIPIVNTLPTSPMEGGMVIKPDPQGSPYTSLYIRSNHKWYYIHAVEEGYTLLM